MAQRIIFIKETPIQFGRKDSLVGVISEPDGGANTDLPGILLLNGGRVHHVGPNRIYVELARMLSNAGLLVLRFDFSGIGDSGDADGAIPFMAQAVAETKEAMDLLAAERRFTKFALLGICSGAMVAFDACHSSREVTHLVMVNCDPGRTYGNSNWNARGREDIRNARDRNTARDYKRAIYDVRRWKRVFTFKTRYRNIAAVVRYVVRRVLPRLKKNENEYSTKLEELIRRDVHVLSILGEQEVGLDYLQLGVGDDLTHLSSTRRFDLEVLPDVDHTFTGVDMQKKLIALVYDWLLEHTGVFRTGIGSER